jgi:hypothetical protein
MKRYLDGAEYEMTASEVADFEASRLFHPVPQVVTLYQGRVALRRAGLFDAVKSLVGQPGNEEAFEAFEYANHWYRDSPWIAAMAGVLGISDEEIDGLFRAASEIS